MKLKLSLLAAAPLLLGLLGCGSGEPAKSTDQEVKDFKGAPMPKDFAAKNGMAAGPGAAGQAQGEDLAKKAAAEAAAQHGGQ